MKSKDRSLKKALSAISKPCAFFTGRDHCVSYVL